MPASSLPRVPDAVIPSLDLCTFCSVAFVVGQTVYFDTADPDFANTEVYPYPGTGPAIHDECKRERDRRESLSAMLSELETKLQRFKEADDYVLKQEEDATHRRGLWPSSDSYADRDDRGVDIARDLTRVIGALKGLMS